MACVSPDGKPTESGTKMLRALKSGLGSPEEIAKDAGLPLFRVRSGLRELAEAGLANQEDDRYELTERGAELIG
ncbi:MAG: winged helix-turn-helix domain-containing protein [Dehalococcoidia bacterium]